MQMVSFTKKKIKRIAAIASLAAATAAVGVGVVLTSVSTQAAQRLLPIYRVERGDNKIALTFDVAWENSNTQELIDILDENNAKATFFITGDWCDRYPEDVKMFSDAGHEIQNHSDQHPHVKDININDLISDTKDAAGKIKMITGKEPTLYRAPYGEYSDSMLTTVSGMGYKVIQWDVDSIDWKEPTPDEIVKRVLDKTVSGSILLFHNDLENTTEALPQILARLKSEGYEFVTVSDLIYHENYTINAQGEQISDSISAIELSPENVDEVMAEYSGVLNEAGFTDEQIRAAAEAVKGGADIPAEVYEAISGIAAKTTSTLEADYETDDASDITDSDTADDGGAITVESDPESSGIVK